jgi:IclR family acetate operon transcriptional repressor
MSLDARYVVKPVRKALQLLEALVGEGRPLTLSELAERTALPKTTAFRYLYTLRSAGFVVQAEGNDAYAAGPRLAATPAPAAAIEALRQAALPEMQRLQLRFNETVNLGVADGAEVIYVAMVGSTRSLRMEAAIGARDPIHSTSLGKAMLAARPVAERLDGLPKRLVKRTPRTITSRTTLAEALDAVAAQGFALDLEENETGAHCVAAAIPLRGLAAALSVSGPAQRLPVDLLPRIGAALVQAVATIAARFEAAPGR